VAPSEYLRALIQSPTAYAALLDDHDQDLALAAYELAWMRLAACESGRPVPNGREIWAAAQEIATATGRLDPVPSRKTLAAECRAAGRIVT